MDIKVDDQQVICFDLDDTLYNELDFLRSAYAEIARNLEPEQSNHLYSKIFSLYRQGENTFDYLIGNYRISKEELLAQYRNHMPLLSPFPGVRELMEQIKSKGGYLVCITDGRSVTQRNKLLALEILESFDLLVISEEIGSTKPAELNYTLVEEHFPQKQYTYIADNLKKIFWFPIKEVGTLLG